MTEEMLENDVLATKVDKPEFVFRLSEKYAIDTDPRNFILLERYEKQLGKGKNAPKSGIHSWKQIGYFQSFDRIADRLIDMEVFGNNDKEIETLYEMADRVKSLKKEMAKFLNEKIEVKLS